MTQEEKRLLLIELCARLPYGVMIKSVGENKIIGLWDLKDIDNLPLPYLRPMSSMTEEEQLECYFEKDPKSGEKIFVKADKLIDYFNAHHFDYRGLIPMGLALEATEGMYKTK